MLQRKSSSGVRIPERPGVVWAFTPSSSEARASRRRLDVEGGGRCRGRCSDEVASNESLVLAQPVLTVGPALTGSRSPLRSARQRYALEPFSATLRLNYALPRVGYTDYLCVWAMWVSGLGTCLQFLDQFSFRVRAARGRGRAHSAPDAFSAAPICSQFGDRNGHPSTGACARSLSLAKA